MFLVFNLHKKIQQKNISHDTKISEEVEELLELFSEEMKLENERLHDMIVKFSQKHQQQNDSTRIDEIPTSKVESVETQADSKASLDNHISKETNEVLTLAQQGYNAEEIAKMLHRGKGEVELLLKFYR